MKAPSRRDPSAFLAKLWALEAVLVNAGFPAMPAWWRREITRFYKSGKRRWVIRKGRRVFASTCVAPRLAVAEMLYGHHPHLPGTPPLTYAFLSVKREEASKRLRGVTSILDVLQEPYSERGDTIELQSRPAVFAVLTANFRTNVGDTLAFAWLDEVASWHDDALSANPAEQIVGRLAPALATLPDAKLIMVSTPLGTDDYHARQFASGESNAQCVSFGASWDINPTLTREMCEELEPDRKLMLREYGGIPQSAITDAVDAELVALTNRAFPRFSYSRWILALDASGGSSCEFASALLAYAVPPRLGEPIEHTVPLLDEYGNDVTGMFEVDELGRLLRDKNGSAILTAGAIRTRKPVLCVSQVTGFTNWAATMGFEEIGEALALKMRRAGAHVAIGDQYLAPALEAEFRRHGLRFHGIPTGNTNKANAMKQLRLLLGGRQIVIDDETTRTQLCAYRERITATGLTSYAPKSGERADRVSVLINALIGEAEGLLPWSPTWAGKRGYAQSGGHITPEMTSF